MTTTFCTLPLELLMIGDLRVVWVERTLTFDHLVKDEIDPEKVNLYTVHYFYINVKFCRITAPENNVTLNLSEDYPLYKG